jgi:endoglucanase
LAVIRTLNPYRMTVIGAINLNSINSLPTLELPEDDHSLIATFHFYDPFQFTHQGAEWAGEEAQSWLGTKWSGTLDQRNAVTAQLDKAVRWAEAQGRPLYLGEFGAYSKADDNSRYVWTDFVARSAEKRNISWTYWEFGAGFGAYDRKVRAWRPLILRALMPGG